VPGDHQFRDGLRSHQEVINRLNVYPVPDGDTGTNMALTLESVTDELASLESPDLDGHLQGHRPRIADGRPRQFGGHPVPASPGARRGTQRPTGRPGPAELSEALTIADQLAREAVMRPVEGTILTVARGAAEQARVGRRQAGKSLVDVVEAARERGGRCPGPHPVVASRTGAGRRGRRRGNRLPAAVRRPAHRGGRAGHAAPPGAPGHRVRPGQSRGPRHRGDAAGVRRRRPSWPGSATR
jgi:hypothetical protein